MNRYSFFSFVCFFVIGISCSSETEQDRAGKCAVAFCESFYNLNYPAASGYVTPSSLPLLQYYASNIRQEHLDAVRQSGMATVSLVRTELDEDEQQGWAVCRIQNFIEMDFVNETCAFTEAFQDTLLLQRTDGKWRIRKDNLQQSGK